MKATDESNRRQTRTELNATLVFQGLVKGSAPGKTKLGRSKR